LWERTVFRRPKSQAPNPKSQERKSRLGAGLGWCGLRVKLCWKVLDILSFLRCVEAFERFVWVLLITEANS
jgi:hypothetical protein